MKAPVKRHPLSGCVWNTPSNAGYVTEVVLVFVTLDGSMFLSPTVLILGRWVACWMLYGSIEAL